MKGKSAHNPTEEEKLSDHRRRHSGEIKRINKERRAFIGRPIARTIYKNKWMPKSEETTVFSIKPWPYRKSQCHNEVELKEVTE